MYHKLSAGIGLLVVLCVIHLPLEGRCASIAPDPAGPAANNPAAIRQVTNVSDSSRPARAQWVSRQNGINGHVQDQAGKPVTGATVLLHKQADSMIIKAALTDTTGNYSFEGIPEGRYYITISGVGYEQQRLQDFQ